MSSTNDDVGSSLYYTNDFSLYYIKDLSLYCYVNGLSQYNYINGLSQYYTNAYDLSQYTLYQGFEFILLCKRLESI